MTTATARMTVGSVFGAVSTAAGAVGSAFNTTAKGVIALDNYMDKVLTQQKYRSAVDLADFKTRIADEKAMEETQRRKQILEFTAQSQENADLFKTAHDRYMAVLDAVK